MSCLGILVDEVGGRRRRLLQVFLAASLCAGMEGSDRYSNRTSIRLTWKNNMPC